MIRTLFAGLAFPLLLTGCADNPPPPRTSVPAPAPAPTPPVDNPKGGVHIDVPGAKVDVQRKNDATGPKVDVNVDTKR